MDMKSGMLVVVIKMLVSVIGIQSHMFQEQDQIE